MYDTSRFIFPIRFAMNTWKWCGIFNAPVKRSIPYRVYCYLFYSFVMGLYLCALALNLFVSQSFEKLVFYTMYIVLTECAMALKSWTIYRQFAVVWSLHETMIGQSFQPLDRYEKDVRDRTLRLFTLWFYVYLFVSHLAALGVFSQLISAEYGLPFFPWFFGVPYGPEAQVAYYAIFIYQTFGMFFHMLLNVASDTQLCYWLQMIGLQLDLLANRFSNLSTDEKFARSFVPLVLHYEKVRRMLQRVEHLFSFAYFVQFSVSGLAICASAYQVASMLNLNDFSKLMNVFYMMSMTMQIGLPCYYGNEVALKSYALTNAIYSSDWYHLQRSNRKKIQLFLIRTNKPFAVTTYGYLQFNLPAFMKILNMAYSVYCVLQRKASSNI